MLGKRLHKCPPKIDGGAGFYLREDGKVCGGMWGTYLINGTPIEIWIMMPVEEMTDVTRRKIMERMTPNGREEV